MSERIPDLSDAPTKRLVTYDFTLLNGNLVQISLFPEDGDEEEWYLEPLPHWVFRAAVDGRVRGVYAQAVATFLRHERDVVGNEEFQRILQARKEALAKAAEKPRK